MKDFLKMLGASVLGCLLVFFVGAFFLVGMITSLVSIGLTETGTIPHKAILHIGFEKPVLEQYSSNPLSRFVPFGLYQDDGMGCYDLVSAIDRATTDPRIDMIYMNTNYLNAGISHIEEIRNALKRFRASGKPVIAYADTYSQAGYYLASVADKVLLNPQGEVNLHGFSISTRYYKGLMDELGIEAQFIRHGTYKSGGEPFTMLKMSTEERDQLERFIQSAWTHWVAEIAEARHITPQTLDYLAEQNGCSQISEALSLSIIDQSLYKDELIDYLCTLQDVKSEKQLRMLRSSAYIAAKPLPKSKAKIALIYATGSLYTGTGQQDIMTDNYLQTIRKLRGDSTVKAVVLRIDSPGGDARAAAIIHHELQLLKAQKPLVISMGDEAASGGYWISCTGDCVFASP
ncbi:MAG: S49 family peptidase, partial [Bacteroidetes bacterium]|nr:S49 family peptidase [Bacteroidota bacterium]